MPNYKNGKIYTIRFRNNDMLIYIGSTTQPLYKRLGGHRSNNKSNTTELKKHILNNNIDDFNNIYIELYENYECESREQLNKREGEVIREFKANDKYICLNKMIAGRTDKEYREDNQEKIKQNREDYKDKRKEFNKQYKEIHKEELKEKQKVWYSQNRDNILKKLKEKVICECGCQVCKVHLTRHYQSIPHLNFLNSIHQTS